MNPFKTHIFKKSFFAVCCTCKGGFFYEKTKQKEIECPHPTLRLVKNTRYVASVHKALFYNIELIDTAIEQKLRIAYDYNKIGIDKKLHRSSYQVVSPYQLILHNQRYYLMAYSEYWGNMVFHRIDRITNMKLKEEKATDLQTIPGYKNGIDYKKLSSGQKFINEVFSTIIHDAPDKQLELDFVYGSIITEKEEKNGATTDVTYFNPLDGQQRLTTLFLMYWFIGGVELNKDERNTLSSILKNFYYKTRTSSTVFCNKLVNELNSSNIDFLLRAGAICEDNKEIATMP